MPHMRLALLAGLRAEPIVPPIFIDVQRGQSVVLPWDSLQHGFFMHAKRAMPHGALVAISLVDRHTRIPVMQAVVTEMGRMAESRADVPLSVRVERLHGSIDALGAHDIAQGTTGPEGLEWEAGHQDQVLPIWSGLNDISA